jgi:hypothetical protein
MISSSHKFLFVSISFTHLHTLSPTYPYSSTGQLEIAAALVERYVRFFTDKGRKKEQMKMHLGLRKCNIIVKPMFLLKIRKVGNRLIMLANLGTSI